MESQHLAVGLGDAGDVDHVDDVDVEHTRHYCAACGVMLERFHLRKGPEHEWYLMCDWCALRVRPWLLVRQASVSIQHP